MVNQATKPEVSKKEETFRKDNYHDVQEVINKNPLCTSCNNPVKGMIINGKALTHPFLETLLCDKCHSFYGDGEFSVDEEDGSDKYCRWCGQGGTLFLCSTCTAGFCKKCIKRNLPRSVLKDVEDDDWKCFCCNVQPLYDLRAQAWMALQHSKNLKKKVKKPESDEDYEGEPRTKRKKNKVELTAEEKAIKVAFRKYHEYLGLIESMCDVVKQKCGEIKTKKLSRRAMESYNSDTVDQIHKKVVNVLSSAEGSLRDMSEKCDEYLAQWKLALDTAKEQDAKELTENGNSKNEKSKTSGTDDDSDNDNSSKSKNKSRKTVEASDEEKKEEEEETKSNRKSRKSVKDSDKLEERTKSKRKSKFKKSYKESDEEEEEESNSKNKRKSKNTELESKTKRSTAKKSSKDSDDEETDSKSNKDSDDEKKSKNKKKGKKSSNDSDDESNSKLNSKASNNKDSDEESSEKSNKKSKHSEAKSDSEIDHDEEHNTASGKRKRSPSQDSEQEFKTKSSKGRNDISDDD